MLNLESGATAAPPPNHSPLIPFTCSLHTRSIHPVPTYLQTLADALVGDTKGAMVGIGIRRCLRMDSSPRAPSPELRTQYSDVDHCCKVN